MGTKWKSRVLVVAWMLLFTFGVSGIFTTFIWGERYLLKDYFQEAKFQTQLTEYINDLNLTFTTFEDAKKNIIVTDAEIKEYRYRYGDLPTQIASIKNQYEARIQQALITGNKGDADTLTAERDKKIEDITNNFKSDDYVRAKIIKEKEQKIDEYFGTLSHSNITKLNESFDFYLKDSSTGFVHTNLSLAQGQSADQFFNNEKMIFMMNYDGTKGGDLLPNGTIKNLFKVNDRKLVGKIGIRKIPTPIYTDYQKFKQKQIIFGIFAASAVIAFLLSLYLAKKTTILIQIANEKWKPNYNRIPIDLRLFLFGFIGIASTIYLFVVSKEVGYITMSYNSIKGFIFAYFIAVLLIAINLIQGKFLVNRFKEEKFFKTEWKKSLTYRAYWGIKEAFLHRSTGAKVFILLGVVFIFGVGIMINFINPVFLLVYVLLFVFIGIPIIRYIIKSTGYFNRIIENTNQLARGTFESNLPIVGKSELATLACNINTIKHGVKTSRREQAKSERLKTELITNVSHDLRTPLTSIITYTELLKNPDLSGVERGAYIEIIDRKSKRLKVLIDDLFEASKMASGNIELDKKKVDMVQLLQQAFAEHNEKINESTLQFRVTNPDAPVYAFVDGQKMWRVFDNLIGNILKYSLENTRVYISIKREEDKAVIIFKNVTKYELSEEIDELFERFKRGDTSRHTEGSGLGLAIARSIVDLHDGDMDIEVDGDLFKVTVTLEARGE